MASDAIATAPLVPLPAQPVGLAWPTDEWPVGEPPASVVLEPLLDELFDETGPLAQTFAAIVVHHGRIVGERYAGALDRFDAPPEPVTQGTPLLSWSMAKSMLHAVVGILVLDGKLSVDAAAPVAAWSDPGDPRAAITIEMLLAMRDGLDFVEDYVDDARSDVIEMLFGRGAGDVAGFAADRKLAARPGERFNYSSGTTNILSGVVAGVLGPGAPYETFIDSRLFAPIGMRDSKATFDAAGTWVASSYVHSTARDFARFGYLYLRGGTWAGSKILPEGWVDSGRRARSEDAEGVLYGAHWWVVGDEFGSFRASGYEGQSILIVPGLDLLVVRLGKTDAARDPHLVDWRGRMVAAFAAAE